MTPALDLAADRVLVLAPTGRDGAMVRERLAADGLGCELCPDLDRLLAGIGAGAGAAIVAQEALTHAGAEQLLQALEAQEPWSDLPVLLLTDVASKPSSGALVVARILERANVVLLQRPLRLQLFLSAVHSAVRARRRQYQMRDLYRDLERAVQLADLFVSILGHDLRTPITAIRLSAENIVRGSQDIRALRPAGRILTAADRMNRMIAQLLDFARVRQGRGIPLEPAEADLGDLCREVVHELEDANAGAVVRLTDEGNLVGIWDADRLAQVISNLVGNAVQHGARGARVDVELDGSAMETVRLSVRNAGAVPAAALPTLFDPFKGATGHGGPTRRTGLGLGLFIARAIVVAHGGDIVVRSEDDRTEFEVTLPRAGSRTERAR